MVDCIIEDARWEALTLESLAERAVRATAQELGLGDALLEISLLATDDEKIAELNGAFRDKPAATNVLSWPSKDRVAAIDGAQPDLTLTSDPMLGDLALAFETCASEAELYEKPLKDHISHLVVHGTLHLFGFDHIRDADRRLMEAIERQILCKIGIADPYLM